MALTQTLKLKQTQRLSPQQIQLMKLLQIPTAILDDRIKEEIETNPALEESDSDHEDEFDQKDEFTDSAEDDDRSDSADDDYDHLDDISEYISDDDDEIGDYRTRNESYPDKEDQKIIPQRVETSFIDIMMRQVGMLNLSKKQQKIAMHLVGSLESNGYLERDVSSIIDDLAFQQNIDTNEEEVNDLILQIQQFDPPGVGARNLQECLLIQLERKEPQTKIVKEAIRVIEKYFDEFTKKHYEKIQRGLNINDEELRLVNEVIKKLNPKPGGTAGDENKGENYIIPDFFISNNNGILELSLNSKNAPDLRISDGYRDMLRDYEKGSKKNKRQKEAVIFIKQKIDSAKWFIDAIKQRQNTLLSTMTAIMNYQRDFFLTGDDTELKPMILKDIAEKTNLDISTVSRVANSKFVQTEFGTYRLKYFFSESLQTDTGEEVSTREVKSILSGIIDEENKKHPYSDEKLTDMLKEKGYNIARRTVAKYREQLNIPVARLRKTL